MIKAYVDSKMLSEDQRDHAIARRNDRGDTQDDRPFQFTLKHQNFGEDDSSEQHDAIAAAGEYHQGEYDTQPGIPGRDRQAFIFVNEADPLEDDVSGEKNPRPGPVQQVDAKSKFLNLIFYFSVIKMCIIWNVILFYFKNLFFRN